MVGHDVDVNAASGGEPTEQSAADIEETEP